MQESGWAKAQHCPQITGSIRKHNEGYRGIHERLEGGKIMATIDEPEGHLMDYETYYQYVALFSQR